MQKLFFYLSTLGRNMIMKKIFICALAVVAAAAFIGSADAAPIE